MGISLRFSLLVYLSPAILGLQLDQAPFTSRAPALCREGTARKEIPIAQPSHLRKDTLGAPISWLLSEKCMI
jgi:hypothetical protein